MQAKRKKNENLPVDSLEELKDFWLPYQKRWLLDDSLIKFVEKGRREGFTYVQAYEDVRDCVQKRYFRKGRPLSVWFTSADLTAAKEYIRYCQEHAELFNEVAKELGEIIIDEKKDIKALCLEFKNGARIYALSSNPTQFRSKGGKVVIDEFAFHDNPQELWKAAFAAAKIWGYPIRVISTHKGMQSLFYRLIEKIKKGALKYSLHTVPIQLAVAEGLADKIIGRKLTDEERQAWLDELREDAGDEATWLEEFCCIPVDESTAFLTYELIESCMSDDVLLPLDEINSEYYVGQDVARKKDLSVIAGGERPADVLYVRQLVIMEKLKFRTQKEILYKHLSHKTFRRANIDATGLGMNLAEDAQIDYGKTKVEDISFTNSLKEELAFNVLRAFQDKAIRIPNDSALKSDLHSIKKLITASGHIRFDADKSETDGHGDRFWAIALLLNAAVTKSGGKLTVKSASPRRNKNQKLEFDYQPFRSQFKRGIF
ncbi:MAG: terminase family protein [Candidatus Gastranaerophilales bacterium]|nr:terminase family protein [Candidatus Gastranaerophilales bacterium]